MTTLTDLITSQNEATQRRAELDAQRRVERAELAELDAQLKRKALRAIIAFNMLILLGFIAIIAMWRIFA